MCQSFLARLAAKASRLPNHGPSTAYKRIGWRRILAGAAAGALAAGGHRRAGLCADAGFGCAAIVWPGLEYPARYQCDRMGWHRGGCRVGFANLGRAPESPPPQCADRGTRAAAAVERGVAA